MRPRLARSPRVSGKLRRTLDREAVSIAAMMMNVVDERQAQPLADRQQILDGIHAVVVLERDAAASARREMAQVGGESVEARLLAAVCPAAVDRELFGTDELGDSSLVLELLQRRLDDSRTRGARHDELIGMEAQAQLQGLPQAARGAQLARDTGALYIVELPADDRVRVHRKNAALHAERSDGMRGAPGDCLVESAGIVERELVQELRAFGLAARQQIACCGRPELDRRLEKRATQTESDHAETIGQHVSTRSSRWPAPRDSIDRARELLVTLGERRARVIVAPHGDADGLSAGAIVIRALERMGATAVRCLPGKGEHVHTPAMQRRLASIDADALVVLDMGSRSGPILRGVPTIVIDHHDAREAPSEAIYVSGASAEPVAPTALLTYEILRPLAMLDDLAWLAWLGTVGDLGMNHPFADELAPVMARYRKTHVQRAVSLVNAARRSARYRPEVALDVLLAARDPADIARGAVAGVDELVACREEVNAELARVARVPPRVVGNVALVRFSSPAQIHPLVATRWVTRLAPKIVIAANDGYLPGRINFAVRSASSTDLLEFLRGLGLGAVEGEFANGHPRATGGSVPPAEFERLLRALGFSRDTVAVPAISRHPGP